MVRASNPSSMTQATAQISWNGGSSLSAAACSCDMTCHGAGDGVQAGPAMACTLLHWHTWCTALLPWMAHLYGQQVTGGASRALALASSWWARGLANWWAGARATFGAAGG